jgi:hypothetical protein
MIRARSLSGRRTRQCAIPVSAAPFYDFSHITTHHAVTNHGIDRPASSGRGNGLARRGDGTSQVARRLGPLLGGVMLAEGDTPTAGIFGDITHAAANMWPDRPLKLDRHGLCSSRSHQQNKQHDVCTQQQWHINRRDIESGPQRGRMKVRSKNALIKRKQQIRRTPHIENPQRGNAGRAPQHQQC